MHYKYLNVINVQAQANPATSGQSQPSSAAKTSDPPAPIVKTMPPLQDPHLPTLSLDITFDADQVTVGSAITATVTVTNNAPDPANDLVVTLPAPQGTLALPGPGFIDAVTGWKWSLTSLAGGTKNGNARTMGASASFTATMQLASLPTGEAVLALPQVTARGLVAPIGATGGVLADATSVTAATTTFDPTSGITLTSQDKRVEVQLPSGAFTSTLTLKHTRLADKLDEIKAKGAPVPPLHPGFKRGLGAFVLEATDAGGGTVHKFAKPVTISQHYTPEQLRALHIGESDLTMFWFDESRKASRADGTEQVGAWVPVVSQIDPKTHTVSAQVDHFSNYGFGDGSSPSSAFVPSLQGFQTDTLKGGTSYSYPLDLPAGPAGIKPAVNLNYNSTALDGPSGQRSTLQAGWVGRGWSLDTGSVALNKLADGTTYYSLVMNGQSFDIVRGEGLNGANSNRNDPSQWAWHTTNESFMKIRAVILDTNYFGAYRYKWQVWSKDGTLYEFGGIDLAGHPTDAWWGWAAVTLKDGTTIIPSVGYEPYKWVLTRVQDTHSNVINYTYSSLVTYPTTMYGLHGTNQAPVTTDIWPASITWGGTNGSQDRYKVNFVTFGRTYDTNTVQAFAQVAQIRQTTFLGLI